MKQGCGLVREKENTNMANTNEEIIADLFRRARRTDAERDTERYEEIEALGNLATWEEHREAFEIRRRSAIRRHRERKTAGL